MFHIFITSARSMQWYCGTINIPFDSVYVYWFMHQ